MSPKNIKKLADKKHRMETGLFMVEGDKNIREVLNSDFLITEILGTPAFLNALAPLIAQYEARMGTRTVLTTSVSQDEVERMGTFVSNEAGIAIVDQKEPESLEAIRARAENNFVLVLDDVRDPGNLGTIIRTADWYGITHIVASPQTTDFYGPKVIAATMGSFTRVKVIYTELEVFFKDEKAAIIAAHLSGSNVHAGDLPRNGYVVMGSESHGVSKEMQSIATHLVTIPRFGNAESLNVSVATGILLDSLRRE